MSSYLSHLKRTKTHKDNRWIVKYNADDTIKEVKLIYNPKEYKKYDNSKPLYNKTKLLEILENDKKNRQTK